MHIDDSLINLSALDCELRSSLSESAGFSGVWATESKADPFLQAYAAARSTEKTLIGTAIVVAFARNPMSVAYSAWELAGASRGRFILGLGTQVRAHIERRFSMEWSDPLARMSEFVDALRAIWNTWQTGEPLQFQGEYYRHDLMMPFFTPLEHDFEVPIGLAAIGPQMTELAGEKCDYVIFHPLTNVAYIDQVSRPALVRGSLLSGRTIEDIEVSCPTFMVMGDTEEAVQSMRAAATEQIAFYAATPTYRPILEAIGYGALVDDLVQLARAKRWGEMAPLVDESLYEAFAVEGTPEQMPALCFKRYGTRVQRTSSYFGWPAMEQDRLAEILKAFSTARNSES